MNISDESGASTPVVADIPPVYGPPTPTDWVQPDPLDSPEGAAPTLWVDDPSQYGPPTPSDWTPSESQSVGAMMGSPMPVRDWTTTVENQFNDIPMSQERVSEPSLVISTPPPTGGFKPDYNQVDPYKDVPDSYIEEVNQGFKPTVSNQLTPLEKSSLSDFSSLSYDRVSPRMAPSELTNDLSDKTWRTLLQPYFPERALTSVNVVLDPNAPISGPDNFSGTTPTGNLVVNTELWNSMSAQTKLGFIVTKLSGSDQKAWGVLTDLGIARPIYDDKDPTRVVFGGFKGSPTLEKQIRIENAVQSSSVYTPPLGGSSDRVTIPRRQLFPGYKSLSFRF